MGLGIGFGFGFGLEQREAMGVLLAQWEGREHPNSPNPHSTNTG